MKKLLTNVAVDDKIYKSLDDDKRHKILGCSQAVRQWTLTPSFRGFKSFHPNQKQLLQMQKLFSFLSAPE